MIEELLQKVEDAARIRVGNRGDCELLSELILVETDEFVSYNTLRRLFGLAAGGRPRRRTLDVLAQYVGFEGYSHFCSAEPSLNAWRQRSELSQLLANAEGTALLRWFEEEPSTPSKLEWILTTFRELFLAGRDAELCSLLDAGFCAIDDYAYSYQIHFATSMGAMLGRANLEGRWALLCHPVFVEAVFLRVVDYSALNGYYGRWADELAVREVSHEAGIFLACLRQLRAWMNRESLPQLDLASLWVEPCPPALLGRIFTVYVMRERPASFDELWAKLKPMWGDAERDMTTFIEPRTFALVTGDRDLAHWLLAQIEVQEYALRQFQRHELQVHYLLTAMVQLFNGQRLEAAETMRQFRENELRRPSFHDFLLFPVRRIQAELAGTAGGFPDALRSIRLQLGHAFLDEPFWHRFFDFGRR